MKKIILLVSVSSSVMAMEIEEKPLIKNPQRIQKSSSGYIAVAVGKLNGISFEIYKAALFNKNDFFVKVNDKDGVKEYKALSVIKDGKKTIIETAGGTFQFSRFSNGVMVRGK